MATLFDIEKTRSFLKQQFNIFYPLKDSRSFLFSKFHRNHQILPEVFLNVLLLLLPILFSYIFFAFIYSLFF